MIDDDNNYEIDAQGKRVLIGLSAEETAEFIRLDQAISNSKPLPQDSDAEWPHPLSGRWLELYEKHESAKRPFLKGSKTRH